MKPWERRTLGLLTLLVTATGLAYFWMKYLMEAEDPFSVVNHPWQPLMLDLHILFSPVLIFVFGIVFASHIGKKLRNGTRPGRRTGLVSLFSLPVMILSGYGLQVASGELLPRFLLVCHLASGSLFATAYLIHFIVSWRWSRRARRVTVRDRRLAA